MTDSTTCAIVGGGPAGMVLGLLLARAGVEVTVLEKHADFLRDFRGDTVHPSTLRLLDDLGLWAQFERLPQSKVDHAAFTVDGTSLTMVDFRRLRSQPHPYIAMVPQWDLLDLLADAGRAEPTFTLRMEHDVTNVLTEGGRIVGVHYRSPAGEGDLLADLTVACDGRGSAVGQSAGLVAREYPVPFDVLWFRLPHADDAEYTLIPRTAPGRMLIMIPRTGYFQIAYLIPKGADRAIRDRGLDSFKAEVASLVPEGDIEALTSMDDVKFLDVRLSRLKRWHAPGLLCIGDAAHAMSPVGGIGINIAVQDAVGAATLLADPLRRRDVTDRDLAGVRRRRLPPAALTQAIQRAMHRRLVGPILRGEVGNPPAALVAALRRMPWLSAIPAYVVGVGVRPERAPAFARP